MKLSVAALRVLLLAAPLPARPPRWTPALASAEGGGGVERATGGTGQVTASPERATPSLAHPAACSVTAQVLDPPGCASYKGMP